MTDTDFWKQKIDNPDEIILTPGLRLSRGGESGKIYLKDNLADGTFSESEKGQCTEHRPFFVKTNFREDQVIMRV